MNESKPVPQHVQDRINHREQSRRIVERLFAQGKVEEAVRYAEQEIDPINDWLLARGIW
ncbi:MAG TPA: hypothetical protein VGI99_00395 [Gemmataceae bacterium]|jgi:hypothetical protein